MMLGCESRQGSAASCNDCSARMFRGSSTLQHRRAKCEDWRLNLRGPLCPFIRAGDIVEFREKGSCPITLTTTRRVGIWGERCVSLGPTTSSITTSARSGGECAAVIRSALLSNARQERHFCYIWDSWRIAAVYEKRELNNDGSS